MRSSWTGSTSRGRLGRNRKRRHLHPLSFRSRLLNPPDFAPGTLRLRLRVPGRSAALINQVRPLHQSNPREPSNTLTDRLLNPPDFASRAHRYALCRGNAGSLWRSTAFLRLACSPPQCKEPLLVCKIMINFAPKHGHLAIAQYSKVLRTCYISHRGNPYEPLCRRSEISGAHRHKPPTDFPLSADQRSTLWKPRPDGKRAGTRLRLLPVSLQS